MIAQTNNEKQDQSQGSYSFYFIILVAVFITCLITANITAVKLISFLGLILPSGVLIFPLNYIAGDVLTEVYGFNLTRRVIWLGFLCNLLVVIAVWLGQIFPHPSFWDGQQAYERILGYTPRLLLASFLAYLVGEFSNSIVLAKMKVATQGRWLWTRTLGSTLVGQGFDSFVFIALAFAGTMPTSALVKVVITQWLVKFLYEVLVTPLTYLVVNFLKRKERLDVFDRQTRFNPLILSR